MSRLRSMVLAFACGAALGVARAGIVQEVPVASADGWYELGDTSYTAEALPFSAFTNLGYIAWARLHEGGLPPAAKVRFIGGVLLDELPDGHTYDFSQLKYLAYVKADVFPSGYSLTVPEGCRFRFCGARVSADYAAGTVKLTADSTERAKGYLADIELNGTMVCDGNGAPQVHGRLTGSGQITLTNFGTSLTIPGELSFAGKFVSGNQQNNNNFHIKSPLAVSYLGAWTAYMDGSSTQVLHYNPTRLENEPPCTLVITNVCTGWGSTKIDEGKVANGVGICVYGGNTVKVSQLTYHDLFVLADTTPSKPVFGKGVGTVEIGRYGSSANGTIHPSPNINLNVGFHNDYKRSYSVNYTTWTNVPNVCTLDLTPRSGWGSVNVIGTEPANLPMRIVCHSSSVNSVTNRLTNTVWRIPFDFGATNLGAVTTARCEAMGVLAYPPTGTVELANVTTLSGVPPIEGVYPIFTGTSGGDGLTNWTVRLVGDWTGIAATPIIGPTGLAVKVVQAAATTGDLTVIRPWTNTVNRTVDNLRVLSDWTLGAGTQVKVSSKGTVSFGEGTNVNVTVSLETNASLVVASRTDSVWNCGGNGGSARFVLADGSTVRSDAIVVSESADWGEGALDFITLNGRSSFIPFSLATARSGTVRVNFNGGWLGRAAFRKHFFNCTNPEGQVELRSVNGRAIELNLSSQNTLLVPEEGSLRCTGDGGTLLLGSGINNKLAISGDCRSRVTWEQRGGIRVGGNVYLALEADEAFPDERTVSLDVFSAAIDFAGHSSQVAAVQGMGVMSNSSVTVSVVRLGADNRDVALSEVLPKTIVGPFVFEKSGSGRLVADRPFAAALRLAAGTLLVTGGTRDDPVKPASLVAAEGTAIVVDGGALVVPSDATLPDDLRIRCRNGGCVRMASAADWTEQKGLRLIVSSRSGEPGTSPGWPVDVTTSWRGVGPGGGGYIQTVQPSRHSAERVMVGCDVGGFFISEDGGRHYEMRNWGLAEMWVETIAEHPTEPDTLIVGGYSIYKSTDRGKTWVEKRTGLPAPQSGSFACQISKIAYDPDDARRVYAAVGRYRSVSGYDNQHLYLSEDGGETWRETVAENQFPTGAYILDLAVDPRNGKRLIASTAKGIYISEDGGVHWTASNNGLPAHLRTRRLSLSPSNPDIIYVTLRQKSGETPYSGGVYKSVDGGLSWAAKNNGLDRRTGYSGTSDMLCASYGCLAVDPSDPDVVYAGGCTYWTPAIWKTIDGGENWVRTLVNTNKSESVELDPKGWLPFDGSLDMSVSTLALSPLGAHPAYFGTAYAVWRSDDGGYGWSQRYTDPREDGTFATAGLEVICGTAIEPDPHRKGRFYLGYLDVGAFVTTNNGASLVRKTLPRDLSCYSLAASPTEPGLVWGTFGSETARRRIMVSRDGLGSWEPTIAQGEEPEWLTSRQDSIVCIGAPNPRQLACIVSGRGVATSDDGGAHWSLVPATAFPDTEGATILKAAEGVLYAGVGANDSHHGRVWKSADGGASWALLADDSLCLGGVKGLCVLGSRMLATCRSNYSAKLGSRYGGCWLSEDAGNSWRRIHTGGNVFDAVFAGKWIALARASNDYYDHFNDNSTVYISCNTGATWTSLKDPSLKNPQIFDLAVDPFDPNVLWATSHGNATFVRRLP